MGHHSPRSVGLVPRVAPTLDDGWSPKWSVTAAPVKATVEFQLERPLGDGILMFTGNVLRAISVGRFSMDRILCIPAKHRDYQISRRSPKTLSFAVVDATILHFSMDAVAPWKCPAS